jgi:hypothetical protein
MINIILYIRKGQEKFQSTNWYQKYTQLETQNSNKVKTQIVGKNKRTPKNTLGRKKRTGTQTPKAKAYPTTLTTRRFDFPQREERINH